MLQPVYIDRERSFCPASAIRDEDVRALVNSHDHPFRQFQADRAASRFIARLRADT